MVALFGELGAGKTRFVRGLAAGLGIDPALVSSPTFVLVNEYPAGMRGVGLVHVDAYRLSPGDDLLALDWERLVSGEGHVLVIEWADRLGSGVLPERRVDVTMEHAGADRRRVVIERSEGRE